MSIHNTEIKGYLKPRLTYTTQDVSGTSETHSILAYTGLLGRFVAWLCNDEKNNENKFEKIKMDFKKGDKTITKEVYVNIGSVLKRECWKPLAETEKTQAFKNAFMKNYQFVLQNMSKTSSNENDGSGIEKLVARVMSLYPGTSRGSSASTPIQKPEECKQIPPSPSAVPSTVLSTTLPSLTARPLVNSATILEPRATPPLPASSVQPKRVEIAIPAEPEPTPPPSIHFADMTFEQIKAMDETAFKQVKVSDLVSFKAKHKTETNALLLLSSIIGAKLEKLIPDPSNKELVTKAIEETPLYEIRSHVLNTEQLKKLIVLAEGSIFKSLNTNQLEYTLQSGNLETSTVLLHNSDEKAVAELFKKYGQSPLPQAWKEFLLLLLQLFPKKFYNIVSPEKILPIFEELYKSDARLSLDPIDLYNLPKADRIKMFAQMTVNFLKDNWVSISKESKSQDRHQLQLAKQNLFSLIPDNIVFERINQIASMKTSEGLPDSLNITNQIKAISGLLSNEHKDYIAQHISFENLQLIFSDLLPYDFTNKTRTPHHTLIQKLSPPVLEALKQEVQKVQVKSISKQYGKVSGMTFQQFHQWFTRLNPLCDSKLIWTPDREDEGKTTFKFQIEPVPPQLDIRTALAKAGYPLN